MANKNKEGKWEITVSPAPITPDGKYVAKLTKTNLNKIFIKYAYGFTPKEAKAKALEIKKEYS
jgi:hypothetical protein